MSEARRATGAFRGAQRGLGITGLLVEAVGLVKDEPELAAVGQRLRLAADQAPEFQREAADALPGLGSAAGRKLGKGIFDLLSGEDEEG